MQNVTKRQARLFVPVLAAGAAFVARTPTASADFIISVNVGSTSDGLTSYVLSARNNGLHNTGSTLLSFDLTVTTPGSGTSGALFVDLNDDTNGDHAADANVGDLPDTSENPIPTFGSTLGTFLGIGSGPLNLQLGSSSDMTAITTPTAVHANGAVATYQTVGGVESTLSAAFRNQTVHSLEVATTLGTSGDVANLNPVPFANVVVPTGTNFSFTGTIHGNSGSPVVVGPQSPAGGPAISLTGTTPVIDPISIGTLTVGGSHGVYGGQSLAVPPGAQTTGFLTVNGFNPSSDKEVYALALDDNGVFLSQTSPVLPSIINDLNAALGTSGKASLVTPAMASIFPTGTYNVLLTFPTGPAPSTATPSILSYDFSGYTTNGNLTVSNIGVIPEPTGVGVLLLSSAGLLNRRRRQKE